MTEIEERMGIAGLEELHDKRRQLIEEYAPLEGFRVAYNDLRKSNLAIRALQIRDEKATAGEKVTEKLIEDLSHGDDEYRAWLDFSVSQLAERERIKAEIEMIDQTINRGQMIGRAYAAEASL